MASNKQRDTAVHHHKRHGKHHRHTKQFLKTYWPYIPMLMIVGYCLTLGWKDQTIRQPGVLAYATNMSVQGLLNETNNERAAHGSGNLAHNLSLSRAAQAKANDMVARNYWSHNTPDGQAPWVFIDQWGYSYQKAGENLAYGFLSSGEAVNAWMNSEGHRLNLLDASYKEVGFGFANSEDFQGSGPQTIVVAMYANPAAAPVASLQAPVTTAPQPTAATSQPTTTPTVEPLQPQLVARASSDNPGLDDVQTAKVARFQTITSGKTALTATSITMLAIAAIGLYAMKHAVFLARAVRQGEQFVLHHPLFDALAVSTFAISVILSTTSGFIR